MNASIRPSGRLSVRVQTHVQMSADKRRDQDIYHTKMQHNKTKCKMILFSKGAHFWQSSYNTE